jgi:hypothetical protein
MKITKENYEAYFLDYFEGNLSPSETDELFIFIGNNPDVKTEFDGFEIVSLSPDKEIVFHQKDSLKKNGTITVDAVSHDNIDEYLVAELEGVLSDDESKQLIQFIKANPNYERDRRIFSHTRLQPDTSIVFDDKDSLKHSIIPLRRILIYAMAAAASVALLFGAYFTWQSNPTPSGLADNTVKNKVYLQPNTIGTPGNKVPASGIHKQATKTTNPNVKRKPELIFHKQVESNASLANQVSRKSEIVPVFTALTCPEITSHDFVQADFMFIRSSQMHRNEYMELYYNVRLAEQIQYALLNEKDKNPERTIFNSLASKIDNLIHSRNEDVPEIKSNLTIWTFAELGVKTYNNFAQDNVKLDLERDEQGKVVSYNLTGDKLDLQRDLKK